MKNLLAALLAAQKEFPSVAKDATNPAFRSRYATLAAVQEAAFPILHKHGVLITQPLRSFVENGQLLVIVGCTLYHVESTEQLHSEITLLPSKADPQGVGSAVTYGRRYTLMSLLGLVADEDDDGNAASGQRSAPQRQATPPRPVPQKPSTPQPAATNGPSQSQVSALYDLMLGAYGEDWEPRLPSYVFKSSNKRTKEVTELTPDEFDDLRTNVQAAYDRTHKKG